jgi:flagellar biosynthesis GTPase FlhF
MQIRSRIGCLVAVLLVALLPSVLSAQGKFTVNGRMKVEGSDLSGARAVVMKDGVKERTITVDLNKFSLNLDLNANYIISFEKEGYVSKKLSFNTHAPLEAVSNGFTPFDFAVSLFKQYDDINIVVFNQPVGMIRFDNRAGDFDYDTDYTKSIQSQLEEVLNKVEQREKDEAANAKERERREAAEAKAKAKADEEAAKEAAARAKAEAEAAKEAEARAAAEAKAQEEAEALRLENERKAAEEKEKAAQAKAEEVAPPVVQAVVPKEEPKAEPPPMPVAPRVVPKPASNALNSLVQEGSDARRSIVPVIVSEESPVAMAKMVQATDARPHQEFNEPETVRDEQLLVETNSVTTVIKLTRADQVDEYRKVVHKWGGSFYFKNGATCSQEVYQREAVVRDALAGATPRSKMD